jgi:hypothetical protein
MGLLQIPEFVAADLLIVAVYGLMIGMPHFKSPKTLILANVFTNLTTALYFGISDAKTGMALCLIAGLSSLSQYLIPISDQPRIKRLRITLGLTAATIATAVFYEGVSDLLICAAIFSLRISEARASILLLRGSIMMSAFAWIFYAADHELYWLCLAEIITFLSAGVSILRARRPKPVTSMEGPASS